MPNSIVKSFAKKSGLPIDEVEKLWDRAETIARKKVSNANDIFSYTVGVLKRMLKLSKKEILLKNPSDLIENYLDESSWRMRAEPKSDSSIIFKKDSFKSRQAKRDSERKKKKLRAQKDQKIESENLLEKLEVTGEENGHVHTYLPGDKVTSENDSHSHPIKYKDGKVVAILPSEKDDHTHSL